MAKGLLAGAVVVLSWVSPAFASNDLALALSGDCQVTDTVISTAKSESTRVWSSAGVRLRWMHTSELPYGSPASEWLVVRCVTGQSPLLQSRDPRTLPIAAIRFVGAAPMNTIVMSPDNAATLLARDVSESRSMGDRFAFLKDLRLGRMLGRSIAHEIGHFLSESGTHTPSGLMRANHTLAALTGLSIYPFKVDRVAPQRIADADLPRRSRGAGGSR